MKTINPKETDEIEVSTHELKPLLKLMFAYEDSSSHESAIRTCAALVRRLSDLSSAPLGGHSRIFTNRKDSYPRYVQPKRPT